MAGLLRKLFRMEDGKRARTAVAVFHIAFERIAIAFPVPGETGIFTAHDDGNRVVSGPWPAIWTGNEPGDQAPTGLFRIVGTLDAEPTEELKPFGDVPVIVFRAVAGRAIRSLAVVDGYMLLHGGRNGLLSIRIPDEAIAELMRMAPPEVEGERPPVGMTVSTLDFRNVDHDAEPLAATGTFVSEEWSTFGLEEADFDETASAFGDLRSSLAKALQKAND